MLKYPSMEILVEGHTDNNGKANELRTLSENRAKAVREYLINEGIDANRIESVGLGGGKPVTANDSEESRSKNRRVDVRVTKLDENQGKNW